MQDKTHLTSSFSNLYQCIHWYPKNMCVKGNSNMTAYIKARLAQLVDHRATHPKVVGSSLTLAKTFHFVFCRFWRTPRRLTGPIQMKSSMTFIPGKRYIETMIIWKKIVGGTTS